VQVLKLYFKETSTPIWRIVLLAVFSGVSNAAILAVINSAAEKASDGASAPSFFIMFGAALLIYNISQRTLTSRTVADVEAMINRQRLRLMDRIRRSTLQSLERIGRSRVYACMTKETETISQSTSFIANGMQAVLLITFTLFYILSLSTMAFLVCIGVVGIGVMIHFERLRTITAEFREVQRWETKLFSALGSFLDGFKEVRLSERRNAELHEDFKTVSTTVEIRKRSMQQKLSTHQVFSQSIFYILTGSMVFVVPAMSGAFSDVVTKITTATLFLIGPISTVVAALPLMASANASADAIMQLEKDLMEEETAAEANGTAIRRFDTLELQDLTFHHDGGRAGEGFSVGPVNLTIRAGECIFITGGNGCGKSTLMRLLTALYRPAAGRILVDGKAVTPEREQAYREMFTAIFSDYHLFPKLYGVDIPTPEEAERLLHWMEMETKTNILDGAFTTVDLSAGQRKRLALIVAMLENRPILVLDEWAADQDPHFRQKFYTEIVPALTRSGVTIIAVTHDDRYFDCCDRRLRMEFGQIVEDLRTRGDVNVA